MSATATIIFRIACNKAIEYMLKYNIIEDEDELEQITNELNDPKIRINEKSFSDFNENLQTSKLFKFNDKLKNVGVINT